MRLLTLLRLRLFTQSLYFQGAADGVCALLQAASITQTAAPDPSPLDQQIRNVDGNISTGSERTEGLSRIQPDHWEAELAYLCGKDTQLRQEKQQLCEEKLLLLCKADTLSAVSVLV